MIDGISEIELLPQDLGGADIRRRIRKLFSEGFSLRASIAFWSIFPAQLVEWISPYSLDVLQSRESYLCADLQFPTNLDALTALHKEGVRVYLNTRRLTAQAAQFSETPGLLHTKMLFVSKKDGSVEIWIGSHNWTSYALKGPNTEVSLVLHLEKATDLHFQVLNYLEQIRIGCCIPFDPDQLEEYKKWQKHLMGKPDRTSAIIELEGYDVNNLEGQVIYVLGTEGGDLGALSTVGGPAFVSIQDSQAYDIGGETVRYLYKATILQAGWLTGSHLAAPGISFTESHRYAYTPKQRWPYLHTSELVPTSVVGEASYFATIQIGKMESKNYHLLDPLVQKVNLWSPIERDPVVFEMEASRRKSVAESPYDSFSEKMRASFEEDFMQLRQIIMVPIGDERASRRNNSIEFDPVPEDTLTEKRLAAYSLIRRKVIKKRD